MSGSNQLSEFFVLFSAKGVEETTRAAQKVGDEMETAAKRMSAAFDKVGDQMDAFSKKLGDKIRSIALPSLAETAFAAQRLTLAFAPLTSQIESFAMAGVNVSAYGQLIQMQFNQLSLSIASAFTPAIQSFTKGLQGVVVWFQTLDQEGQAVIRWTTLAVAGFGALAFLVPRLVSGFGSLAVVFKGLQTAMNFGMMLNPWLLLAGVVGGGILASSPGSFGEGAMAAGGAAKEAATGLIGALSGSVQAIGQAASALANTAAGGIRQAAGLPKPEAGRSESQGLYGFLRTSMSLGTLLAGYQSGGQIGGAAAQKLIDANATINPMTRFFDSWMGYKDPFKSKSAEGDRLEAAGGGFEQVDAAWRRVALASRNLGLGVGGGSPEEQTAAATAALERTVANILNLMMQHKPAIAPR